MKKKQNARAHAAKLLQAVLFEKRSLTAVLSMDWGYPQPDRALIHQLCYGCLRHIHWLEALVNALLERPLPKKQQLVQCLLFVGLYQLSKLRVPDHAAVSETVAAARQLGFSQATKLLNACLRRFQRESDALIAKIEQSPSVRDAHPPWLWQALQVAWPSQFPQIIAANNTPAPQFLRVDLQQITREQFITTLAEHAIDASAWSWNDSAVRLTHFQDITTLPGFAGGVFSVQDPAAQLAAPLLQVEAGQTVLDACAAPGGKTCHLLTLAPELKVWALDVEEQRLTRCRENVQRCGFEGVTFLAQSLEAFSEQQAALQFDRILLDVPCSATGVIRRHPDIKVLRQAGDIPALAQQQQALLRAAWGLLKPGGQLLYTTCSILPEENDGVIQGFLADEPSRQATVLSLPIGRSTDFGWQVLPGDAETDGFYYALLAKPHPSQTL